MKLENEWVERGAEEEEEEEEGWEKCAVQCIWQNCRMFEMIYITRVDDELVDDYINWMKLV